MIIPFFLILLITSGRLVMISFNKFLQFPQDFHFSLGQRSEHEMRLLTRDNLFPACLGHDQVCGVWYFIL